MTIYKYDKDDTELRNDVKKLLAVHARRTLAHNIGAIGYMALFEACLARAERIQVRAAMDGKMSLELKKKVLLLLPHHHQAIKRLYKPAEAPPKAKVSNSIAFGGGVPPPNVHENYVALPKPKYRFGQACIDQLHVRHLPPAKILISVISDIVDYIVDGKARKKLGLLYGAKYGSVGGELVATFKDWETINSKAVKIGPKHKEFNLRKPTLKPKEKEKSTHAKQREKMEWIRYQKKRDEER